MKIIRPVVVNGSNLTSSTVSEPDTGEAIWNSGTAYGLNAQVIRTGTHRRYQSVQAANTGRTPETEPTWWVDVGPTTKWAMFDQVIGTVTTDASPLTVVLTPGIIDTVALLDVSAGTVRVSMVDGVTTVYDQTINMESAETITDWYAYFFDPITRRTVALFTGLPPYSAGVVTITLTDGSTASVGTCIVGKSFAIGGTQYGAKAGINDYSRKVTDEFGAVSVVERTYAKRISAQVICQPGATDEIARKLASIRATPVLWIGSDLYESLVVYGFFKEFEIDVAYPNVTYCSLSIEGLT